MRKDFRKRSGQFRMWAIMALCLAVAIAASLLAPITWRDYFLTLTAHFGWPLIAAILTSAIILVISLYAAKRRRASGIIALSIFISMVLHMLAASYFGFMVIRNNAMDLAPAEKKNELSTGLPSLTESVLSQEVRAKFNETVLSDSRKLETGKKSIPELAETKKPVIAKPELKPEDLRDPEAEKVKAELASRPKAKAEEILAKSSDKIPDVSQAKVTLAKQVETKKEIPTPVKPVAREVKIDPLKKMLADKTAEAEKISMEAKLKDAQREHMKEKVAVAAVLPAGQRKIEDSLQKASFREKANNLELPAGTMAATGKIAEKEARATLAGKGSFDVTRQEKATPDAPSAKMLSRELAAAPVKSRSTSLADSELARSEKQPLIKDTGLLAAAKRQQVFAEPVRISDTLAAAVREQSGGEGSGPVISARGELNAARISQVQVGADSIAKPRASVNLEAGTASAKTFVSAARGGDKVPAPAGRSKVQEGLLSGTGRGAVSHQLVDVGGSAEAVQVASADTRSPAGQAGGFPARLALDKAETGIDNSIAGSAPVKNRGNSGLTSRSSSYGKGSGVQTDLDVPSTSPRAGRPVTGEGLAISSTNSGSILMSLVDVGGEAVAVVSSTGNGAGGNGTAGTGGGTTGPREGRELSAGKNRGGAVRVEADSPFAQMLVQEGIISGTGTETSHKSLMDKGQGTGSGGGMRKSAVVAESSGVGNGSGSVGAQTLNAKIIPGVVQSMQGGGSASEAGSGGTDRQELARIEMRVGKAEAGIPQDGSGEGKRTSASVKISGRASEHSTSLVDSDVASVTPHAGSKSSGLDKDFSLAKAPGTGTAGGGTFALGISAREATGEKGPADGAASSTGPSSRSEVRVGKAGGQLVTDSVPGGGSGGFDSSSMSSSSSAGRAPARMEVSLADSGSAMAGRSTRIPTGNTLNEMPRTVISSELSDVPKSVPEKAIYKLRTPERRKEVIKELGGSDKTEQAVERGLAWLALAQSDDGRWDVDGFKTLSKAGGAGDRAEDDVALTGLCLLSYLGAGYTHVKGDHKETVRKALNWLIVGQKENGDLQREGQMYGQAMATAAICESYSMTGDKRLLDPAEKAIKFILDAQNPGAGWRYQPRKDNDTSVTGWQVLALKSAMIAGIKIPPQHFEWVGTWLDKVRLGKEGGLYSYMSGHGSTPTMTAEGWFCQLMMGEQTKTRGQAETIPYLMANQPVWSPKDHSVNLYYWYYATLALHMSGTPEFEKWNQALTKALLAGQVKGGQASGSWDPVCILGERGGRVYMTATAALCLEVYYRYLPFYKQK